MLRTLGWFLSVFWLVGLLVHLSGMVHLLGIGAVSLFLIDLLVAHPTHGHRPSRAPRERPL